MATDPQLLEIRRRIEKIPLPAWGGEEAEAPPPKYAGAPPRFKRILVAFDGSQGSQDALAWAKTLAKEDEAAVIAALALPPTPKVWGGPLTGLSQDTLARMNALLREEETRGQQILETARRTLEQGGVEARTALERGKPGDTLPELAATHEADLVTMGSHGRRGVERLLLGSVSDVLKDRTTTNVLVARNAPPVRTVVLAVDGSHHSRRAAAVLERVVPRMDARVHIVHVLPLPFSVQTKTPRTIIEEMMEELHKAFREKTAGGPEGVRYELLFGNPAERILEYAADVDAGLIVMGARGLSRAKGFLLGSVSNRVAHQAEASVLLVRNGTHESDKEEGTR